MNSCQLTKSQCPECAKKGRDTSKDNLALYPDGGCHCFACGYHEFPNKLNSFKRKNTPIPTEDHKVVLPPDISTDIPLQALRWIEQYELTKTHLLNHNVMWSQQWQRLIFPFFIEGKLLAWQGRYFGPEQKAKWFTQGDIHSFLYPLGVGDGRRVCCLVEDIVSAIKVSSHIQTIPIFGSTIGRQLFTRLKYFYDKCYIWLDPDMKSKMLVSAQLGSLFGLQCPVIYSDKDPKEHTNKEIKEYLDKL